MRKGIFAFEEFADGEAPVAAEVTDFVDAPENDLADAAKSEGEMNAVYSDMDDAVATADSLDEIHGEMEKTVAADGEGMSEAEARPLDVAVEHMCANVGLIRKKKMFAALEGRSNKASRRQVTLEAMADIKATVKKIWDAMMAALRKAWDHVVAFFQRLTDGALALKKRAETLAAAAARTKGGHGAEGKKISTKSFGQFLTVGGKLPEHEALVAAYAKHCAQPVLNVDRAAIVAKAVPILEKVEKEVEGAGSRVTELKALFDSVAGGGGEVALVFGGRTFKATSGDNNSFGVALVGDDKAEVPGEVHAMESETVAKLATAVAKQMGTYAGTANAIQATVGKLTAAVKTLANVKADHPNQAKVAATMVRNLSNAVTQSAVLLKGYDVKIGKAVLDYAGASLGGLKQEKAEKAAAPAA